MTFLWLLLQLLLPCPLSKFLIGRLREGQFEHSLLNGWMDPGEARRLCEGDQRCGGFTYKGFISEFHQFDIFFFHLVLNYEDDQESWNWVTYKAERDYISFPGLMPPSPVLLERYQGLSLSSARYCVKVLYRGTPTSPSHLPGILPRYCT